MEAGQGARRLDDDVARVRAVREAKYVQLTTFKRDGTGVPTPVWSVEDAGALLVWLGFQCARAL